MLTMLALLLLPLISLSFALPTTEFLPRQTKPYQIRGVEDPIYYLYLQALPSSKSTPVMGPVATSEYFVIGDTIQSTNTLMYLNIGTSTTSYLPLSFNSTASTTAWRLEGDTIITESTSSYGRRKFQGDNEVVLINEINGIRTQFPCVPVGSEWILRSLSSDWE
jgi:hypothetical protein